MRVNEAGAQARERRAAGGARRFREALRRAKERGAAGEGRGSAAEPASAPTARRSVSARKDRSLAERRDRLREEERSGPPGLPRPAGGAVGDPVSAELRALLRSLPAQVQIEASRVSHGEPLTLSFGRSLDVELRPSPSGVELLLRPSPRLARAAAAEVPGIVAALRARGVAVTRAGVRARGEGPAGGGRPAAR